MKSIFSLGFGSLNREERLKAYLKEDYIVAVILSAAHFEWTLKRSILKLSKGPTVKLKRSLEETHRLFGPGDKTPPAVSTIILVDFLLFFNFLSTNNFIESCSLMTSSRSETYDFFSAFIVAAK